MPARICHSSIFHDNKLIIYGGMADKNTFLNDLWIIDFDFKRSVSI